MADLDIPKVMPVEMCGAVSHCMASPQSYENDPSISRYRKPSQKEAAAFALQRLEAARAIDIARHEKNSEAIEANRKVREVVTAVMKAAGIPDEWSRTDPRSRSRFPKKIRERAGYFGDLERNAPIRDGFENATLIYEGLKAKYDAYAAEAEKAQERAEAERAAAEERRKEERRANVALATIVLRYGLPAESEWDDVLDALRKRDQRIDLAVAMSQTRSDYSDGPHRVHSAIGRFKVETDEDKAIANDVLSCLNDWDGDGRIFRDTRWSYDAIFASIADQQLAADAQMALERTERDR